MSEFKKFRKGQIKRNFHFYSWAAVAGMLVIWGLTVFVSGTFDYHGTFSATESSAARFLGIVLIFFGSAFLYYLFFKAEAAESKHEGYHDLDNFEEKIDGHNTKFEIEHVFLPSHKNTGIDVFFYKLKIDLNKNLCMNVNVRKRDKIEYFIWKIGLTRIFDILTQNHYFDSKYRVKCKDKVLFRKVFNPNVIRLLEKFDKDYPPIRNKNGILVITDAYMKYTEGPYSEDQRLFDPHRGKIEDLFRELIKIISVIERSVPNITQVKDGLGNPTNGST